MGTPSHGFPTRKAPIMKVVLASLVAASLALPASAQMDESRRVEMPGQIVVSFTSEDREVDLEARVFEWGLAAAENEFSIVGARSMLQWQRRNQDRFTNIVMVEFEPASVSWTTLREKLVDDPEIAWAAPNVGYLGDPRELTPNDPQYGSQYHHTLMQNDVAWDVTLGDASIIIGVTDDGLDTDHEDLNPNVWTNSGEIAGDSIDNDGNGYIDDVNGWDFVTDNNDPNPNNTTNDHGTHVAGIAAAKTDNGTGVAGTAGDATIMPLQFFISGQPWTAENILEAFTYGVDNGAQIITTSYNINGWVGDPLVTAGFDYMYDSGVLHFNSAGNGAELNPARQAFHQSFLVVNTDVNDEKSSSSNYGTGVDISAPGSSILSTELNDTYGLKSGTSMSAPNAAGVAALLWAANPTWTREQVAAQLLATCDNIDAQNPGLEGLLGSGRVNAGNALTTTLSPPTLTSVTGLPEEGGLVLGELGRVAMRFDQILDPASVNGGTAFRLDYAGADGTFGTGDDSQVALEVEDYLIGANEIAWTPVAPIPAAGTYRFTADATVLANPFGAPLDGNGDGAGGDSFVRNFEACATLVLLEDNAESGVDWFVFNENLTAGAWTQQPEVPNGGGVRNDPPTDFDGSGRCFLTENGPGNTDVDGGPTRLISRRFDVSAQPEALLSYARWIVSSGSEVLEVDVSSDDGATWTQVEVVPSTPGWQVHSFRVADFVAPTAVTRLRFSVQDSGNITEAAIDQLRIIEPDCVDSNPVGSSYCVAAVNSAGVGATIGGFGSDVVADNDFELVTEGLPGVTAGLYFFGTTQIQVPFGNGFRCAGGQQRRIQPAQLSNSAGELRRTLDLTGPPAAGSVVSGTLLNFQLWYRDSSVGAGFNLSDGLSVSWQ